MTDPVVVGSLKPIGPAVSAAAGLGGRRITILTSAASRPTDSYLVVDDRSAPLRSEDGVQQGAPLATTSFCVAIHPEIRLCDSTLEVTDGAARFTADDGYLVGLRSMFGRIFTPSDKMQAYRAYMEAARREAPADIE
eukprot:jgi/Tetstr1/430993/TSEL_020747.t1